MNGKTASTAILAGAIALFLTGYAIFDLAFGSFYAENGAAASGLERATPILWSLVVAHLAYAALITFVIANREGPVSIGLGTAIGALTGFLVWATVDYLFYGFTDVATLALTLIDPLLELVHGGIGGAVIAAVLTRMGGVAAG